MFKSRSDLESSSAATQRDFLPGAETFPSDQSALSGDLSVVTIENLMQLVGHAGLSGELHLATTNNSACFIIRGGVLIFGYVQCSVPRIGERLVRGGHIAPENLRECLDFYRKKKSKLRLGEILVARQYVSGDILEEVIKEQVRECFFSVLSWKEGFFSFRVNESPPDEDILLAERIDYLIIEGIVAMDNGSDHGSV